MENDMRFDAVIFDLDGTLLDTLDDIADSMNAALARFGFATHPVDAYRYFVGDGPGNLVRRTVPKEHLDAETIDNCDAANKAEYLRRYADKTKPYPGILEMLSALQGRGIPMVVLSNKPDELTQVTVKNLLPDFSFKIVRGVGPDVPAKPDPSGTLRIAEELQIAPRNFLYLGDTNTDMQTANSAGMYAVGAVWGFRTREELERSGAKTLAEKPQDILELLARK